MGFILAALFFNTLTAPVVKMTQNSEGGYDYNKWSVTQRGFRTFPNFNIGKTASPRRRTAATPSTRRCRSTQVHLFFCRAHETRCSFSLVF